MNKLPSLLDLDHDGIKRAEMDFGSYAFWHLNFLTCRTAHDATNSQPYLSRSFLIRFVVRWVFSSHARVAMHGHERDHFF
jgi:hypothetical protein